MNTELLSKAFAAMGARIAFATPARRNPAPLAIDIDRDSRGELYLVRSRPDIRLEAIDIRARQRHLLLLARTSPDAEKEKFLCGHDEREWFVAAVPPLRGVSCVEDAFEALKPPSVRALQTRRALRNDHRLRRRNAVFIRQGEWFFIPEPGFQPDEHLIRVNEPLTRGRGSKPHLVDRLVRSNGELVYVARTGLVLTESQYHARISRDPNAGKMNWTAMRRNATAHVRGRVRHPDHATILLDCWHRVEMNTENQAPAMRHVTFLD